MATLYFRIEGMSCAHCSRKVHDALLGVEGVDDAEVSLEEARAEVEFDPARATVEEMVHAVGAAGYAARAM